MLPASSSLDNRGVPPLGGICSYEEAAMPGLPVDQTVDRLKRFNYVLRRLHEVAVAHLPSVPEWEVKCALALHAWIDADHVEQLRSRVAEMREPPHRFDDVPDERLEAAIEEVIRARDTVELLGGAYCEVRAALIAQIERHLSELNPLFDHPTYRMLRTIVREQRELLDWGLVAHDGLVRVERYASAEGFRTHVRAFLAAAGGVLGCDAVPDVELPAARWDGSAYEMDDVPRRDDRFTDPFNATGQVDHYYTDESRPADERVWALAYKRLREMDVPEWIAPIIYKTPGKPWQYHKEMSRQLWDEARHAMMGEVALVSLGIPFYAYPIDMSGSTSLNLEFSAYEAHVILWEIEQGLMPGETGKRREWEVARLYGDDFFVALQDYDWADEVLHAQIGRRWLTDGDRDRRQLKKLADDLMARWQAGFAAYAARATGGEWWPEFVERARAGTAAKQRL